jgi:transcriptional regulator with XRE-family HTH domain
MITMTDQLREIGRRLAALREMEGMGKDALASRCRITAEELDEYEQGKRDFSFSFLYNAARILGVDVVDIMDGDSPKLSGCCVNRSGEGYSINRRAAYNYKHLAFTFRNKLAEPFMVTVDPPAADSPPPVKHTHAGQEFNLLIEGRVKFFIGDLTYDLEPGDSVYFESATPHAMLALDNKPAKFLAIVMQPPAPSAAAKGE